MRNAGSCHQLESSRSDRGKLGVSALSANIITDATRLEPSLEAPHLRFLHARRSVRRVLIPIINPLALLILSLYENRFHLKESHNNFVGGARYVSSQSRSARLFRLAVLFVRLCLSASSRTKSRPTFTFEACRPPWLIGSASQFTRL